MSLIEELTRALQSVPDPVLEPSDAVARGIEDSVAFLQSEAALRSIALDPYWPKWNSPWWHALLLFELGEGARVPAPFALALVLRLDALPMHTFPVQPHEFPPNVDHYSDIVCHCALGSVAQVTAACGIDLSRALPWVAPWFPRYQMTDGGLSCDESAYLVTTECPSSMVGTIAPFEAMRTFDVPERAEFLKRAAQFLIGRGLCRGSNTQHNEKERTSAEAWPALTFPRFYFYDTLRGLAALVHWAESEGQALPLEVVAPTALQLVARFPDGVLRIERQAFAATKTVHFERPVVRTPASTFPLLEASSVLGAPSVALTQQWKCVRSALLNLAEAGLIDP
jgi:hypothetical protein